MVLEARAAFDVIVSQDVDSTEISKFDGFRHLNIPVMSSMESHRQEVIGFLRENGYHGILADDSEYCIFDPPRWVQDSMFMLSCVI